MAVDKGESPTRKYPLTQKAPPFGGAFCVYCIGYKQGHFSSLPTANACPTVLPSTR